jgi:hypothetical protein
MGKERANNDALSGRHEWQHLHRVKKSGRFTLRARLHIICGSLES